MKKKLISASILCVWVVMLGLLLDRVYLRPTAVIALDAVTQEGIQGADEWFGIYQQGRKIGYAHTRVAPETETYKLFEESELDILVLGSVQRVKTTINAYATKNFLLKYFDFAMQSGPTTMKIKGAVVGKKLTLDIESGGRTRTERIVLKEPPYLSPNIKPAVLLLGLEPGRRYRFPVFNPATMSTEDAFVSVITTEKIKVGDAEKTIYKLREEFQGMETFSWMTQDGKTIKEESPLGYVILAEAPGEAIRLDKSGPTVDIISLTRIPSNAIHDATRVRYLRARLKGVPLHGFQLDRDRQINNGDVVEISAQLPSGNYRVPYRGKELREYLQPNALVQSDDKRIRDQSAKILARERDAKEAAKKLNEWVYNTLAKKPVVSIPSAVAVLDAREGDCNEHTTLYTALARAAGIPTRMIAGIVYMEDGFYYHAWPEVWLGEWVAVDPTFNQFPADATHIRFVSGNLDRQGEIMKLVGKLKVEVLDYK